MKIIGIKNYSYNPKHKNDLSLRCERQYSDTQDVNCINFRAKTTNLNKSVFIQRNIIEKEESLSKFVDKIFNKIYQHDISTNYQLFIHPQLKPLFNDIDNISYKDIVPFIMSAEKPTIDSTVDNFYKHTKSLIPKGMEYQKQCVESINKVRSKAYDILVQNGFSPEELHNKTIIEESKAYKRFEKLLKDSSIEKELQENSEILVLPDKDNKDTTVRLQRTFLNGFDLKWNELYEINLSEISYKDSKLNYHTSNVWKPIAKLTADDGSELEFEYCIPRREIFNDYNNRYLVDKKISSLKSQPDSNRWKYVDSFFDIKDRTNNIIYTFQTNNGTDKLVSIYDIEKGILLADINASKNKTLNFVEDAEIVLGTSLYTNLLRDKRPMGACIVLPYDVRKDQSYIKKELEPHILNGVGTGFDLSETKNPVETLNALNEILKEYDSKTERPPAGIAILDVTHSDILEFINAKRNVDFNGWRFNISVAIPNEFMQKVTNNENVKLMNGKEVSAKSIYSAIIDSMHYCGEPGIVFKDRVEATNPLPNHKYRGMASCAEIGLEEGEMCLFSHINLSKFLDKNSNKINYYEMGKATEALSKALDNVIDINISEKVGEDNIASQKRRFGIGVCGFADLLANMKIPYGSRRSLEILANCLEVINYSSKKASMELAKEKGKFPLFDESRYNERDFLIKHSSVGSPISQSLWDKLYDDIQKYGLRNATTTALPPTGSSSRIVGASYSIEPYFDLRNNQIFYEKINELDYLSQEEKQQIIDIVNKTGSCQDIKSLQNLIGDTFRLGNEISYQDHLKVVGIAQKFIDDGISKTINLEKNATKEEIDNAIRLAYDLDLKGISVFRDGCLDERNLESI